MARKTAPAHQRLREVRSWHVHRIPNVIPTFTSIFFVTKFNQKRNNVICPKQLCCADQHLMQHTQAQFRIDRSGIRLNSKLFAQTVVRTAVIMWRKLVKRANPSYIFQEDEDRTRCNRHVRQPSLAQHALDANTWTGGGSLGYFAHASAKFTEARLSQTSQNVRIGGFVPPFFLCPLALPPTSAHTRTQTSSMK